MARTAIFSRNQPGGMFTLIDVTRHIGAILFVSSVNGVDSVSRGQNPDAPLATLDYAIGMCVANAGDVIYLMPGHAESYAAAAGAVFDVAGITVVGLGSGSLQPKLTFTTATTADIDIDAANVTIENVHFVSGFPALAGPIDVNAADFKMKRCRVSVDAAANHPLIFVLTDANANGIEIDDCDFDLEYDDAVTPIIVTTARTAAVRLVGADYARINNNRISGNFTVAAIDALTTACRGVQINNNKIRNVQTTNIAGIIDLVAGTTGVVANNVGFHGYVTDIATAIDPASCAMIQNYVSNVVTEAGGLVGTAST